MAKAVRCVNNMVHEDIENGGGKLGRERQKSEIVRNCENACNL